MSRINACEAFIRLENLYCMCGLEVSGELIWPDLASLGQG